MMMHACTFFLCAKSEVTCVIIEALSHPRLFLFVVKILQVSVVNPKTFMEINHITL